MTDDEKLPSEAPTMRIETQAEYRQVLERVRVLEAAETGTAEALERAALERAVAAFIERKHGAADDAPSAKDQAHEDVEAP